MLVARPPQNAAKSRKFRSCRDDNSAALAASCSSMGPLFLPSISKKALCQMAFTSGGRGTFGGSIVAFPCSRWKSKTFQATRSPAMRRTPAMWS